MGEDVREVQYLGGILLGEERGGDAERLILGDALVHQGSQRHRVRHAGVAGKAEVDRVAGMCTEAVREERAELTVKGIGLAVQGHPKGLRSLWLG